LQEVQRETATLVFFESPHRVRATLADMVEVLGGERPIALCREMTKLHEEIWRGSLAAACREWAERERCRGEFTLVVAGAEPPPAWDRGKVKEALIEMMASGIRSGEAVRRVRDLSGWPKGEVYTLAEQIKEDRYDDY
jgi:16S rRNA (cytidine1402-2'-O)-methyltransferase